MSTIASMKIRRPELLDVVALIGDRRELGLSRGAVGTVVEPLDDQTSLVEFSDDSGQAQTIVACPHRGLQVLSGAQG
jgi:Domain of unknown function (DUF4926)